MVRPSLSIQWQTLFTTVQEDKKGTSLSFIIGFLNLGELIFIFPDLQLGKTSFHMSNKIRRRARVQAKMNQKESQLTQVIYLHDLVWVPQDGIVVEIGSRVKPKVELHLPPNISTIAAAPDVHIGLQSVWLSWSIPHELNVHLIMEPRMYLVIRKLQSNDFSNSIVKQTTQGNILML